MPQKRLWQSIHFPEELITKTKQKIPKPQNRFIIYDLAEYGNFYCQW